MASTAPTTKLHARALPIANELIEIAQRIEQLDERRKQLLDQLEYEREMGFIADKTPHLGWTFQRSPGRQSWIYPEAVGLLEAQVQAAKEAAVATGAATAKPMTPFWTLRKPAKAKLQSVAPTTAQEAA